MDNQDRAPRHRSPAPLLLAGIAVMALLACGDRVRGILGNTILLATPSTLVATILGTVLTLLTVKTNAAGRHAWLLGAQILIFVPLFVHVAGWKAGFGVGGWFNWSSDSTFSPPLLDGWGGAIWIHAMAGVPWAACIVAVGLGSHRSGSEEAASLVVSPWRVLGSITLPSIWPSVLVAYAWVFLMAASEMTVTDFFQIRTFAEEIYTQESMGGAPIDNPSADEPPWARWPRSVGLVAGTMLLATVALGILLTLHRWLRRRGEAAAYRPWVSHLTGASRATASLVPGLILLVVAGLPIASLCYKAGLGSRQMSTGWIQEWSYAKLAYELGNALPNYHRELLQSLWVGLAVATTCTLVGTLLAWRLRTARRPPLMLLGGIALLLAIPGPLLGLMVIRLMNQPLDSPLGWLTPLYDRTIAPWWLVQSIRYVGVAALVIMAAMAKVPETLLEAARVDRVGGMGQLARVVLPLSWRGVVVSWLLTFALSVGDLAASVVVAPPMRPTLSIQIFRHLHYGADDRVAAISLILLFGVATLAGLAMWLWSAGASRNSGDPR